MAIYFTIPEIILAKDMQTAVLIVNWGTDTAKWVFSALEKLKQYRFYLATTKDVPPEIERSVGGKKHIIVTNPYDKERLYKDVMEFIHKTGTSFKIVTTFFEMNVTQTAFLMKKLKIKRGPGEHSVNISSANKERMRKFLASRGICQPNFNVFETHNYSSMYKKYMSMNTEAVIKPICSGHSYGARHIPKGLTKKEFIHTVEAALSELDSHIDEWMAYRDIKKDKLMLEEYIPGPVFSFDGMIQEKGRILYFPGNEFFVSNPRSCVQIGHLSPPAHLSRRDYVKGKKFTNQIINKIGLKYCGFHCEVKFKHGVAYLIEIAARLPGARIMETYQDILKDNVFGAYFKILEGHSVSLNRKALRSSLYYSVRSENRRGFYHVKNCCVRRKGTTVQIYKQGRLPIIWGGEPGGKQLAIITLKSSRLQSPELYALFMDLLKKNPVKILYV